MRAEKEMDAFTPMVDVVFEKKYFVPAFPLPENTASEEELLREWVWEGARERYADEDGNISDKYRDRIEYEVDVIAKLPARLVGAIEVGREQDFFVREHYVNRFDPATGRRRQAAGVA